eukprot:6423917-Pyramimonas_sp.AAC.1
MKSLPKHMLIYTLRTIRRHGQHRAESRLTHLKRHRSTHIDLHYDYMCHKRMDIDVRTTPCCTNQRGHQSWPVFDYDD